MLRACFDDCRTIGSLKLVHHSSTTLFRPRFEMSQGEAEGTWGSVNYYKDTMCH